MPDTALDTRLPAIAVSSPTGAVSLQVCGAVTLIEVAGEPNGSQLVACLRSGIEQRRMRPPLPVLVDLTEFTGAVDWSAIGKVARLSRAHARGTRVAYLVRNPAFALLVKAAAMRFPRSLHRSFLDRRSALAWLGAGEPTAADA